HGTHVAGIAAAIANNGKGIVGVDWNASIYSKRLDFSDNTAIYNSIVDAVNQGCHVLNNSWGGATYSTIIRSAFSYAYKMNRVAVVSMGNNNTSSPKYPAAFGQGIIAVGATDNMTVGQAIQIMVHT
ncbi:S8 family serine peptidase, partial [candidate division TA06 bacterium]|nr:S8 family serine peptidase [candidate division TA06 bacterium]